MTNYDILLMRVKAIIYEKYITSTEKVERLEMLIAATELEVANEAKQNVQECSRLHIGRFTD